MRVCTQKAMTAFLARKPHSRDRLRVEVNGGMDLVTLYVYGVPVAQFDGESLNLYVPSYTPVSITMVRTLNDVFAYLLASGHLENKWNIRTAKGIIHLSKDGVPVELPSNGKTFVISERIIQDGHSLYRTFEVKNEDGRSVAAVRIQDSPDCMELARYIAIGMMVNEEAIMDGDFAIHEIKVVPKT